MINRAFVAGLGVLAISLAAHGQQVIQVDSVQSQAQVRRDEHGFSSCGIRVVALRSSGATTMVLDFSVMFYVQGLAGFAKFGASQIANSALLKGSKKMEPILPAPTSFWIARVDQAKAVRPVKYVQGEDAGYTLGVMAGADSLQAIDDIATGKTMHFNVRYNDDRFDVVNQFSAPLSTNDAVTYRACIAGIGEHLKAD